MSNEKEQIVSSKIVNEKENYEVRLVLYEEVKSTYNVNKEDCKDVFTRCKMWLITIRWIVTGNFGE